mgnify:CR=1 FL=1
MLIITVSYIIGILLGLYLKINMAPFIIKSTIVAIVILSIIFVIILRKNIMIITEKIKSNKCNLKKIKNIIIISIIPMVVSCIVMQYKESKYAKFQSNISQDIKFIGTVIEEEKESEYYNNYIVKINNINEKENYRNICLLIKIKKNKNTENKKLKYGDMIFISGLFEHATTRRNYKGFDYSQYLKTKNIYGICKTDVNSLKVIKENSCFVTNMWINKLRNALKNNLQTLLPSDTASIAIALFLGDSSLIEDTQKQTFSNASLSHVLAISGMHVTYVIVGCSWILNRFDKRKSKYVFIVFLIFFAQLVGGSPSVIRAVIMSSIMIASKIFYRKSDVINNISISCFIILIINPYNILNLGFQLSFLGTLGIILFNKKIEEYLDDLHFDKYKLSNKNKKHNKSEVINKIKKLNKSEAINKNKKLNKSETINKNEKLNKSETINKNKRHNKNKSTNLKKLKSFIITSISANILILPILIYNFNIFSVTFLFSNILISPILGIIFLIGYITVIISVVSIKIAIPFAKFLNILIKIFNYVAIFSSNIEITRVLVTTPNIITVVLYYIAIIYFFYYRSKVINNINYKMCKRIIVIFSIVVILAKFIPIYNNNFKIFFIDVGQGDSTLIITKANKTILIDGGGSEVGDYNVGEKVLVPYLLNRKIKNIDYMIFSHFDSDHCGRIIICNNKT